MPTTTRDRIDEIQALEELWAAPAADEPKARACETAKSLPLVPGAVLAAPAGSTSSWLRVRAGSRAAGMSTPGRHGPSPSSW